MIVPRIRAATLVIVGTLALLGVGVGSASAAPPDTSPCLSGGYVNYIDPATSQPFANQGQCVSTVSHGGTLVPKPPGARDWAFTPFANPTGPFCHASVTLAAAADTSHSVAWVSDGSTVNTVAVVTDDTGTASASTGYLWENKPASLVVDDVVTLAAPTVTCHAAVTSFGYFSYATGDGLWKPGSATGYCNIHYAFTTDGDGDHWAEAWDTAGKISGVYSTSVHVAGSAGTPVQLTGDLGDYPTGDVVTYELDGVAHSTTAASC